MKLAHITRDDVIDALTENILTYGSVQSRKARLEKKKAKVDAMERDQHSAMITAHEYDIATARRKISKAKRKLSRKPTSNRWAKKLGKAKKSVRMNQSEIRKYRKMLGQEDPK